MSFLFVAIWSNYPTEPYYVCALRQETHKESELRLHLHCYNNFFEKFTITQVKPSM